LKVNPLKFVDKAVKSNRARVTNLIGYLPNGFTTAHFKELLIKEIKRENSEAKISTLSPLDIENIQKLVKEKYETWDWNFGFSPNYNFKKAIKVAAGFIELHLDVQKGYIERAKIFGDFFASKSIHDIEILLVGKKHELEEIDFLLRSIDLTDYFGKVDSAEILTLFK